MMESLSVFQANLNFVAVTLLQRFFQVLLIGYGTFFQMLPVRLELLAEAQVFLFLSLASFNLLTLESLGNIARHLGKCVFKFLSRGMTLGMA